MASIEFSSSDLAALAAKLDQLADRLSDRERALLLATFQMAGDQLNQLSSGSGGGGNLESVGFAAPAKLPTLKLSTVGPLPPLSSGFRDSFARDSIGGAGLRPTAVEWDASVSVMGGGMG
jgi:hypothetical protein